MKTVALASLFLAYADMAAQGQGTVNFINIGFAGSLNAPVYMSDGLTPLSAAQFMAELLAGPSQDSLASIATTGFLQGAGAGYFNGGSQYINTVAPGSTAWVQVDVWNTASGATFDQAKASGLTNSWWQSSVFRVQTAGGFQGPPPTPLTGLGTSPVYLNGPTLPLLTLTLSKSNTLLFSWFSSPGAFVLEENSELNTTNWNTLTNTPFVAGPNQVILAPPRGAMFYRLVSEQTPFSYTSTNGSITITAYAGSNGVVTIPNTINGLPVTYIAPQTFYGSTGVTSVTIPANVSVIGDSAFGSCANLTNVGIGDGVKYVGASAFSGCPSLQSVTIPENVTGIGPGVFSGCSALTNITIGNNVTNIESGAFSGCTSLPTVTIGNSVTEIGYSAFSGCTNLGNVIMGNSVTAIVDFAFDGCSGLTNVVLGSRVAYIGYETFHYCTSLSSIAIPNSVTTIGGYAFGGCAALPSVTISSAVTYIGGQAFAYCPSLVSITVDTNNPNYASVDGVLFDKSRTLLLQYPGGRPGSSYVVPDGVLTIGESSFTPCANLTSIAIGNTVTDIGLEAFYSAATLTNITLGTGLTTIESYAFTYCSGLPTITIPESVTDIGASVFWGCYGLTSITIGSRVGSIGDAAFGLCADLSSLYFRGDAAALGPTTFFGVNAATVYYLPGTSSWDTSYGGFPTAPWVLPYPIILKSSVGFGAQPKQFGFTVSWSTNLSLIVEASTNLVNPVWQPLRTNALTGGSFNFSDPQWTNYPNRFYRLRWP